MAGSVNKVILVGNLGADPEVKSFQNGGRIANLRIATSENWKDRATGERKEARIEVNHPASWKGMSRSGRAFCAGVCVCSFR